MRFMLPCDLNFMYSPQGYGEPGVRGVARVHQPHHQRTLCHLTAGCVRAQGEQVKQPIKQSFNQLTSVGAHFAFAQIAV